ncbi:hypothetical protein QBC37DRAFT_486307 [Rhypophila decipiens]|uniref:Uncharacterized protein n=1 Tax=Rhypophila decipiens TaxID=261697 RepID=A0AAN6XYA8_9PEZI|nr:hypothetical protein QBC37DRAFT_486307 [Rhypophila decipiens]
MGNATPGTLAEFDLVLSVTEASLNAQFMRLFLTPLDDDDSKFLISHSMVLKTSPNSKAGIFGSIECPQVHMDLPDVPTNARVVSVFKWWDESKGDPELQEQTINGWTFSFECSLGQANIQQIEEQYLHPSTADRLQSAIDNKSFQPASLFCLFETGQLARSFQMADATGKAITDDEALSKFKIGLTTRFAPPRPGTGTGVATPGNGLPTPENPFVLGYGVSQVDPKPLPQTPQFDPQNFQFSVTHQPNGCSTINFLMLLGPITKLIDVTQNLNAGIFTTPFLAAIGADAPGPTGRPQYDGTLVISAKSFKEQYIAKQLQDFFAMPNPTFPNVAVHNDSTNVNWKSLNSYNTTAAWHSDQYGQSDDDVLSYNGTWTNDVAITSNYANQQMPVDAARNLTIKVSAQAWVNGTLSAETTIQPINLEYNVTTSSLGAWTFTQKTEAAKLPPMQDDPSHPGQKQLKLKGQNEKGDALEVKTNITGSFFNRGTFNWQALMNQITDGLTPVARSIWAMYNAYLSTSLSSINTQIVMPAGNVFTFNGLSLDKDNNLYTLMKHQTQSGREHI